MRRFDVVKLTELKYGDRFYFQSDAKKLVWEVVTEGESVVTVHLVGGGRTKQKGRWAPVQDEVVFLTTKMEREAL